MIDLSESNEGNEARTFKVPVEKKQHLTGFVVIDALDEDAAKVVVEHQIDSGVIPDVNWSKEAQDDDSGIQLVGDLEEIHFKYTNKYKHCGEEWEDDECDSMHNDKCPKCNKEIEPYESVENATGSVIDHIGDSAKLEREQLIIDVAKKEFNDEGTIEVDDTAEVSEGDDNGAYVQAWAWVSFDGTKLSKEVDADDKPGHRICDGECVCEKCGNHFFKGDTVFCVPDHEDNTLKWYDEECIPDEYKSKPKAFKPKQKATVKLSDGSVFTSGTLYGAKNAATTYASRKGKKRIKGTVEMVTRTGKHIQYNDQWF